MKTENSEIVKKNTSAIHVDAKLTLMQRRASNALLYNAYDNLLQHKKHSIDVKTLCALIGYEGNNDSHLKKSLKELTTIGISWNILDKKGETWGASALLASAEIKNGVCTYEYSSALAERFYDPRMFALINLSVQRNINSSYALALYENCLRYVEIGRTGWIEIDDFRKIMGVFGNEYYKTFKKLNQKIIATSVREVNLVSDIIIEPEFEKDGRKIARIRFSIKRNPQKSLLEIDADDAITHSVAYKRLIARGISELCARNWIIEYSEDYVIEKLDHTEKIEKAGRIKSTASGFLTKAIEEDYKTEEAVQKEQMREQDEKRQEAAKKEHELQGMQSKLKELERTYRNQCVEMIEARFEVMSEREQKELIEGFRPALKSAFDRTDFSRTCWKSLTLAPQIRTYWQEQGLELSSFEEFCQGQGIDDLESHKAKIRELETSL